MKPVIGIAVCGFSESPSAQRQFVSTPYIHAIEASGGIPVLLPITDICPSMDELSFCDGFLFCGGNDITPALLGEDPLPGIGTTDLATDIFHLALIRSVLSYNRPLLAICRGMQVLNTALGGSIYQDISLTQEPCISHFQQTFHRSDPSHKVTFTKNSILHRLFGSYTFTNSYHHQIIQAPAPHLIPSAFTDDGVIEALESDAHTFALGVQWHPECMYDTNPDMCALFDLFITISCKNE